MTGPVQDALRTVFVRLLAAGADMHASITRMKAVKLLYLIDLETMRATGDTATGVPWQWHHYGPWEQSVVDEEDALVRSGVAVRERVENFYGSPEYRIFLSPSRETLPPTKFDGHIEAVMREFGRLSASTLSDLTYQTAPMLAAQEGARRGVLLDLEVERVKAPATSLRKVRERLKPVADRLPRQGDEGGVDDLIADMDEFDEMRRRTSDSIL